MPYEILRAIDCLPPPSLQTLPAESEILDLCCGTGKIAARLAARGFRVTGIDESPEMLVYARRNAPTCRFIHARAQEFTLPARFAAAVSTFDSLNHIFSLRELRRTFRNVYAALADGGAFIFDLNTEKSFRLHWREHFSIVRADGACIMRGGYNANKRRAQYEATVFRLVKKSYRRSDFKIVERCYTKSEVRRELQDAGFKWIKSYDAEKDLGMTKHTGRVFFQSQKKL